MKNLLLLAFLIISLSVIGQSNKIDKLRILKKPVNNTTSLDSIGITDSSLVTVLVKFNSISNVDSLKFNFSDTHHSYNHNLDIKFDDPNLTGYIRKGNTVHMDIGTFPTSASSQLVVTYVNINGTTNSKTH